jgi:hypothetical protein
MSKAEHELTNQEKLDEMYELTLENHEILRSIRRNSRVANTFTFFYWLVVLGALGGAYIYVSPLIKAIADNRDKIENTINQVNQMSGMLPEKQTLEKLLNSVKSGQVTP